MVYIQLGNLVFSADYLFDNDYDLFNLTDQRIGKLNNFQFYPANFTNLYGFTTTNWTYTDSIGYGGVTNGTQLTDMYLIDFPGGVADTVEWDIFYYDQCYGYSGTVAKTKNLLDEWETANGTYYDGQTVAYGNSCYVTEYDRYSNMDPMNPAGVRNYHWVINQASNLGTEEIANVKVLAYPNPVNDELTVNLGEINANGAVLGIFALDGTQIASFTCDNQIININTSEIERGTYLLTIDTQEGEFVKKFIKN